MGADGIYGTALPNLAGEFAEGVMPPAPDYLFRPCRH